METKAMKPEQFIYWLRGYLTSGSGDVSRWDIQRELDRTIKRLELEEDAKEAGQ